MIKRLGLLVCTAVTLVSTASLTGCTSEDSRQKSAVNGASVNDVRGLLKAEGNLATAEKNGTLTLQTSFIAMYPTMLDALQVGMGDTGTSATSLQVGRVKQFNDHYIIAYTYDRGSNTYITISDVTKTGIDYTAEPNGIPETGKRIDPSLVLSSIRVQTKEWSAFASFVKNPRVSAVRLIFSDRVEVSKLSADDRLFEAVSYGSMPLDLREIDLLDSKMNITKRIML